MLRGTTAQMQADVVIEAYLGELELSRGDLSFYNLSIDRLAANLKQMV